MFVRATCFSYIDFLDIDGLINLEVGNKNVQRFETERLRHTRGVDSRKRDTEQMCPFGTGTELCSILPPKYDKTSEAMNFISIYQ